MRIAPRNYDIAVRQSGCKVALLSKQLAGLTGARRRSMKTFGRMARAMLALAMCAGAAPAMAQGFPARPVHLVVPFAAGGAVDLIGRTFAQKLSETWKQQVVVDNRAGAGGNIGADAVAKAPPDGYTLLINISGQAISAGLYRKLPFDPVKDFTPVTQLTSTFLILVCNPGLAANSVKELISLAKSRPGKLNYGSTGLGASPHLVGELFKSVAGVDIVHVPYKGDAPLTPALLTDEVQFAFLPLSAALQHMRSGKLRALAVTGARRGASIPEVPTLMEAGLRDFEFSGWIGIFAPGGAARDLVGQISSDFVKALNMPDVLERLPGWGYEPVGGTPDQFAAKYKADIGFYTKIIREAKVPLID
jgi:tripartite-type tricarboxylate transporter receptor subunit TctC